MSGGSYGNVTAADDDYAALPTANKVIEVMVLILIIVVSVIGNASLWIVVLKSRALRTLTSMFILGLSAADLLVATVNMPLTVYTIIVGHWTLSKSACVTTGYLNMLTLVTSVLSLCNISINRYFMVCHPTKFKDIYTRRNAIIMITLVVVCSALLSMPPLVGWSEYVYTHTHSFCFADWANHMSYAFFMIGCCFGVPFGVMTVCNICIIRSVRHSRRRVKVKVKNASNSVNYSSGVFTRDQARTSVENTCYNGSESSFSDIKTNSQSQASLKSGGSRNGVRPSRESVTSENNNRTVSPAENINNTQKCNETGLANFAKPEEKYDVVVTHKISSHFERLSNSSTESDINSALINHSKATEKLSPDAVTMRKLTVKNNHQLSITHQASDNHLPTTPQKNPSMLHPTWRAMAEDGNGRASPNSVRLDSTPTTISIGHSSAGRESRTETPKSHRSSTYLRRREEIRLAFSLVVIVVIFVICWLPYCVSMLLSVFHKGHVPREFHMFTLIIGYANSGMNPIIYGVMNKRFNVGFRRLFCFWKKTEFSLSSS